MIAPTTLLAYFDDVYCVQRAMKASSEYFHRRSLVVFTEWRGKDTPLKEMDDSLVSSFILAMVGRNYSPHAVKRFRRNILSTIRHAARNGLAPMPIQPRDVRIPPRIPEAWTKAEVKALLNACDGVRHGAYLAAVIRVIWDTGIRYEDARRLSLRHVDSAGNGILYQEKTGDPLRIHLRAATLEALSRLDGTQPLKYGSKRQSYVWWAKLCKKANVSHGGPQKLRRSAASELAKTDVGGVTTFLGHRTGDMARRHYIDPRIAGERPPQPGEL